MGNTSGGLNGDWTGKLDKTANWNHCYELLHRMKINDLNKQKEESERLRAGISVRGVYRVDGFSKLRWHITQAG